MNMYNANKTKMMKTYLWMLATAFCLSCSSNDLMEGAMERGGAGGTDSSSSTGTTGSLMDFDITWDDVDEGSFTEVAETVPTDETDGDYEDFVENSSFTSQVKITYDGTSATVSGDVSGVKVNVDGGNVTVNSSAKGVEYVLTGTATDGAFKIYSDKKFKLALNGVSLTSTTGAAINVQSKKRVFVEAVAGTTNSLTDAAAYTNTVDGEDQKACLFSEGQLLFSGSGKLTVNGNYKHGICSDEYVYIHSGTHITVASAPKDGIHTNDKIVVGGGVLTLTPSGDGLDCEEGKIFVRGGLLKAKITGAASKGLKSEWGMSITGGTVLVLNTGEAEYDSDDQDISSPAGIKCGGNMTIGDAVVLLKSTGAAGKGLNVDSTLTVTAGEVKVITTGKQYVYGQLDSSAKGIKADGVLTINGGLVQVITSGGEGSEGIESKSQLVINDGSVAVHSYDDCLNASDDITVNGGYVYCYSDGNDAIDSNGTLNIAGGTVVAAGTTAPEGGFDCDNNTFKITGGTLLGIGGESSTPTSSASTQASVVYGGSGTAGTLLSIVSADGTQLMSYVIPRTYNQMTVLYSSPALTQGTSYVVYTGGSASGGTAFNGLTTGGSYTAGTQVAAFTQSSVVATVGNVSGGAGNGGPNPGGGNQGGGPGGRP